MCSSGVSIAWSAHRPSWRISSDCGSAGSATSWSITVTSGRDGPTRHPQYQMLFRFG